MELLNTSTEENLEAVIEPVSSKDFRIIRKSKERFDKFDWNVYRKEEVYNIRLVTDDIILGLMCLIDHTDDETNAIEIELLEVSKENIGSKKKFDYIAGCLIAYACRESFKRGHDGCVFLTPKTSLLAHYPAKYGFHYMPLKTAKRMDGFMILYDEGARRLIKKYLD
jgi:hypothetical protein